eukprot:scaffold105540_cov15-Tisochrysis_lutea.AAC.1
MAAARARRKVAAQEGQSVSHKSLCTCKEAGTACKHPSPTPYPLRSPHLIPVEVQPNSSHRQLGLVAEVDDAFLGGADRAKARLLEPRSSRGSIDTQSHHECSSLVASPTYYPPPSPRR